MPYLNWKTSKLGLSRTSHPRFQNQLELSLDAAALQELRNELAAVFSTEGASQRTELKLELPQNWTLYWKAKEGLSRMQLAHPQTDHWVATVQLSAEVATRLLEALAGSPNQILLSQLGTLASINNLELILRLL